ncbi:biliverdin-producing heme oxygenase [Actinospica durhamensis]|uniref:Biliverdin-producing heme oxygenase n=1 Tax=Actinospica durhamensis TaxID=1508375 RepID=A0A941IQY5_9ACTN|nr:biliverdin-producing heme oxygenase [Actinospica durhamensis]MBR7838215.1 biliverdin-producing heme oxygenase [Actinospica durhamensis]
MDVLPPVARDEALCVCGPRAAVAPADGVPPVFLRLLLAGALEPVEYAELLVQYRAIYAALDRAAEAYAADDPLPRWLRAGIRAGLEDLEADLAVLLGARWSEAEVMPATCAYVDQAGAAAASVEGLVAHHLVRYGADRLGAGHIRLALGDAYGPLAGRLAFHGFRGFRGAAWSGGGEPAGWTHEQCERVAAEAALASACDRALLDALGDALARR